MSFSEDHGASCFDHVNHHHHHHQPPHKIPRCCISARSVGTVHIHRHPSDLQRSRFNPEASDHHSIILPNSAASISTACSNHITFYTGAFHPGHGSNEPHITYFATSTCNHIPNRYGANDALHHHAAGFHHHGLQHISSYSAINTVDLMPLSPANPNYDAHNSLQFVTKYTSNHHHHHHDHNFFGTLIPHLWSQLPQELVEHILAFLPIPAIFRFTQVCKSWRSLFFSRAFLDLLRQTTASSLSTSSAIAHGHRHSHHGHGHSHPRSHPHHHRHHHGCHSAYFLALNRSRYQHLAAYEAVSRKWYSFPLDFLPSAAYFPVASSGGLICFLSSTSGGTNSFMNVGVNQSSTATYPAGGGGTTGTLTVCNPLTRKWKELPPMLSRRAGPFSTSLVVDRASMTYKILVAGGLEEDLRSPDATSSSSSSPYGRRSTEMYDSTTGEWTNCGSLPRDEVDIGRSCMVEYSGYYLCLTRGPRSGSSGLLAFNLETRAWIKMRTGRIPGYSKFRHLLECRGSILVVGKALRRYVLGLYIWCLDPATLRWREVAKMPRLICEQFFSSPSECFYCTAQAHFIFFGRYFYNRGFVYNTIENSWHQVGGCPLLTHPLLLPFSPGLDPVD